MARFAQRAEPKAHVLPEGLHGTPRPKLSAAPHFNSDYRRGGPIIAQAKVFKAKWACRPSAVSYLGKSKPRSKSAQRGSECSESNPGKRMHAISSESCSKYAF